MAIRQIDKMEIIRPVEKLRIDFSEFAKSDMDTVELIGYEEYKPQSIRSAAIKVMHEYDDSIRFFVRKGKLYLSKVR